MEFTEKINIFACATDPGGARNIAPVIMEAVYKGHNIFICSSNNTKSIFNEYNIKSLVIDNFEVKKLKELIVNFKPNIFFAERLALVIISQS